MEGILNLENWRKFGNDWVGYYKDSTNCSIFYIPINKIITKWLINNICYYLHINRTKNAHLRIYK
jgi:hypothetical protein